MAKRSYPASEVGAAGRSYPTSEVRDGQEGIPCIRGQGWRPGGDTPRLRSGAARRSHLPPEARAGDPEEPPTPEAGAIGQEEHPEEW